MTPARSYFEHNAIQLQGVRFPLGLGRIEPPHPGMVWQHESIYLSRNDYVARYASLINGYWTWSHSHSWADITIHDSVTNITPDTTKGA